jgi:hypothetical protein
MRSLMGSTQLIFLTNSFQHNTPPHTLRFNRIHSPNRGCVWIRKAGAITAIGLIATIINLILNPQALTFLGFTAAAFVFDLISSIVGFNIFFKKAANTITGNRNLYTFRSRCRVHYGLVFHGWSSAVAVG